MNQPAPGAGSGRSGQRHRLSAPRLPDRPAEQLTAAQLRELHEELGTWLERAGEALPGLEPHDGLVQLVHNALVTIARERAGRQRD